ncbi:MAG: GDP-mannose 4,6-dehydratase [Acidobacteriota bacterium]
MTSILLTGGAGFIGSHLAQELVRRGHTLVVVDDLNDFYPVQIKRANLAEVSRAGNFEFVEADICDAEKMSEVFSRFRPQLVFHLAARAGVRPSLEQPLLYERTNVQGTLVLLEQARQHQVRRFIFASSSSVYGSAGLQPFSEDETSPFPLSPYGVTKLAGEKHCYCYAHLYGIQVACLRFFTVYGPRQRPDLAIHKFSRLMRDDLEIPVFGEGDSMRDYTYIDDVVSGILAASELESPFEILNLGNSHPVSLNQMISCLESAFGKKARIRRERVQPGDMAFTHADLRKARLMLGYEPKVSFAEGIARFAGWFQSLD